MGMKKIIRGMHVMLDQDTGELHTIDGVIRGKRDRGFVKIFKQLTTKILKDIQDELNPGALMVLIYIINELQDMRVGSEPMVRLDPAEIAAILNKSESAVRGYIATLRKHAYIEQSDFRSKWYRFCPEMAYRGILCEYMEQKIRKATQPTTRKTV